jgi:hypothetical protein
VFDSARTPGPYSFRYWVDEVTPPRLRLLARRVPAGGTAVVSATDTGAGVDPQSVRAVVDGTVRVASVSGGRVRVPLADLGRGRHVLEVRVSDYQEAKNSENVPLVMPNTAVLKTTVVVR